MSLPLLSAVANYFINKRPLAQTAKNYNVEHPDLLQAVRGNFKHTWRGKLIVALAIPDHSPEHRPDLIPFYTQLARLEEHYGILMNQYHRAEEMCASMRTHKEPLTYILLMKADAFANRIGQQCMRVLKEIQKTEATLTKASSSLPTPTEKKPANKNVASTNEASTNETSTEQRSSDTSTQPTNNTPQTQPEASTTKTPPPDHASSKSSSSVIIPATNPPEEVAEPKFPYTKQEFETCLLRYRHRIKNTPAQDRPKLMLELLEIQRAKQTPANQNGKHAA